MVAEQLHPTHPILACVHALNAQLTEVADFDPLYMSDDDKRAALVGIAEVERRLGGLKLRTMAASKQVAEADGARDVAAWLASRTRANPAPLRVEQRLACAVEDKWPVLGKSMAEGMVSVEQGQVIVAALEALPARVGVEVIARAEAHLVALAVEHDPKELRILGRRILDLTAPEIAEGEEAKRLEEEEQRARDNCRLSLKGLGDGTARISGLIPETSAQRLATYLHAFTSPRKHHDAISGEEDRIPYRRQLAQAFCSLIERLDPDKLPEHGGDATTLMVTIGLESLKNDLGVGSIIGGESMSATAIRHLACTAGIVPVVLGGKGDLAHGRLYCTWHHHRAHDPSYRATLLPNGKIRFTRRT